MEASPQWATACAYWITERELRAGGPVPDCRAHVPDAEVWWPATPGAPEETWAVECELSLKGAAKTAEIKSVKVGSAPCGRGARPLGSSQSSCRPSAVRSSSE